LVIGGDTQRRQRSCPGLTIASLYCAPSTTSALKAGLSPKVVSERIGHADAGFFLQTYAHVLKNDDRDAAEQAASFLLGASWDSDDEQG